MDKDKNMNRDDQARGFDRRRFEQEVAEEIGISLDRAIGRASRRSRNQTASPGASATGSADKKRPEDEMS